MLFEIAVDDDGNHLVLLRDWLIAKPAIRRNATVGLTTAAVARGTMGTTADLITLVADKALDVGNLLIAVAAFMQARKQVKSVRIRRGDVEVTVTGTDRKVLEEAKKLLEDGEP